MSIPAWFAPRQETMIGRCATTGMILTILSVLLGCGEQGAEPPKPPSPVEVAPQAAFTHAIHPPPAVRERLRTEPATRRAVPELVTAPGEVALDLKKVAKITSRIGGQVEHIHVQLGDRVKPAQPLAAIGSLQLDQ
ncbi:MAG: efflux RND transporter periplasmic adaptor subunit, partial [Nitrospira sp.]|nr:efflux RND transporter periplasmic adaptor subunit [Nitrospira sp.]